MRLAIFLLAAAGVAGAVPISSGTEVQIRLTTALKTASDKAGQPFEAVVIAPVVANGRMVIGAGAKIKGHVKEVKAASQADDQAVLTLSFDTMSEGGRAASLAAKVESIDNARESVDADGKITGIKASETGSARLDQGINKVAEKYPGLGDLLNTVKQTVLKEPDVNIDYEPGVEMTLALTKPLEWTGAAPVLNVKPIQPEPDLLRLVASEPVRTMAEKPARPSDITNFIFLGSQEQLDTAFEKAGWSSAARLNSMSKLETFRAMAEDRGYKEAPVSTLLLDGAPPDLVYEKLNDTFAARHHLRIWHRPGKFNGEDIWICSATHDTGIDFSEKDRTFIHKIDSEIDHERAKVVNDLLFTGLVRGLSLVERDVPQGWFNATGDELKTDGSIAVIEF